MSKRIPGAVLRTMLHSSVRNYGIPGLTSCLVGGNHHGTVRLFDTDRNTYERITPHSHRYDFAALVLSGRVENVMFHRAQSIKEYQDKNANAYWVSFLENIPGEDGKPCPGKYNHLEGYGPVSFTEKSEIYLPGDWYTVKHTDIHCIHFEKGTTVLMFEGPNIVNRTTILEPFTNGVCVPTFTVAPWMFVGRAE